jgi:hypothetical protein
MIMPVTQFVFYPSRHEYDTWPVGQNFGEDWFTALSSERRGLIIFWMPTVQQSMQNQFQHRMALLQFNVSPYKETFNILTKPPGENKQI